MSRMRGIKAALVALGVCGLAQGAPPEITYIFPAGGAPGQTTLVSAAGSFAPWPVKFWSKSADLSIAPSEESGKLSISVAPDAPPGWRWLRAYNAEGASAPVPFLVGNTPEIVEIEPNDSRPTAQSITGSVVVHGKLAARGDVDSFAVRTRRGETLVASVIAQRVLNSPVDMVAQIVSPRGTVLAQIDDSFGLDPRVTYEAPADGVLIVRVFGFPASADSTIGLAGADNYVYRLAISTGGVLDWTRPLAVQAGVSNALQPGGPNISASEPPLLVSPAADATECAIFRPGLSGWLQAPVEPNPVSIEVEPNGLDSPMSFSVPACVSGCIENAGDQDAYRFSAAAGHAIHARLRSRAFGYPLDGVLRLMDDAGQTLVKVDDQGEDRDPEIVHRFAAEGSYRLVVSDLYDHGGPRYFYSLSVHSVAPDFAPTVSEHAWTLQAGVPLEIAVQLGRSNGFAEEIRLRLEGAPETVTLAGPMGPVDRAQGVASISGTDTADTVKLILTSSGGEFSGPIRVICETTNASLRRPAYTHLAGRGEKTSDFWLTTR